MKEEFEKLKGATIGKVTLCTQLMNEPEEGSIDHLGHNSYRLVIETDKGEFICEGDHDSSPEMIFKVAEPVQKCECHERDSSYVCDYCYKQGLRGHMQE